jgi:hypothetical protein
MTFDSCIGSLCRRILRNALISAWAESSSWNALPPVTVAVPASPRRSLREHHAVSGSSGRCIPELAVDNYALAS